MSDHQYYNHDDSFEVTIEVETSSENHSIFSNLLPQILVNYDDMTFQELFALMYYSEKPMKFLPLQDRFLDTIDQVIDSHHLEKMIQSNISDYLTVVKQEVQKSILSLNRHRSRPKEISSGYLEVIEKIFNSQCCIEEIGKEVEKVIQIYQNIECDSFVHLINNNIKQEFVCQEYHTKSFQDNVYNDQIIKDFLDEVTENVTDKDQIQNPTKTQLAQLTQNYSILLKQQTNQQQRQLPKPSRSPINQHDQTNNSDQKHPYAFMDSRFPFPSPGADSTEEFFNLIQGEKNQDDTKKCYSTSELRAQLSLFYGSQTFYNQMNNFQGAITPTNSTQQIPQSKKKRNKKSKPDPGQHQEEQQSKKSENHSQPKEQPTPHYSDDYEDARTKPTDEIKEFERRLDAVHENLRNDQKLPLNVSKEWIKKMHQMHQKTLKQARAQRN